MNYFDYDSFYENDLYEMMMPNDFEDWLPSTGIKEQLDPETLALLNNF